MKLRDSLVLVALTEVNRLHAGNPVNAVVDNNVDSGQNAPFNTADLFKLNHTVIADFGDNKSDLIHMSGNHKPLFGSLSALFEHNDISEVIDGVLGVILDFFNNNFSYVLFVARNTVSKAQPAE